MVMLPNAVAMAATVQVLGLIAVTPRALALPNDHEPIIVAVGVMRIVANGIVMPKYWPAA
jgi:hypothetical protein